MCSGANASSAQLDVPIVLFLNFNRSHVRTKYKSRPGLAYARELNRILWFVASAKRVDTRLPLYVTVSGDRNASGEALLRSHGVNIVQNEFVQPPKWASTFHHFSFTRIAALSLTQFRKVIVMDNDMALLGNVDDLASDGARAPGMVWHTATVLPNKEHCAVTGGLFVLEPNLAEYRRALHHLYNELNIKRTTDRAGRAQNQGVRCYDGSDQEFWRSFYRPTYELPLRYHAHQNLKMSNAEWRKIRVIHTISGFRRRDRAPPFVRKAMRYFDQPNAGWVGGTSKKVR